MKKGKLKGSFTVEAVLLQGLLLLVIFLSIALYWYSHNRIWFTAAACEAAITGSMEESWNPQAAEGIVEDKLEQIQGNQAFPCKNVTLEKSVGESQIRVSCRGENSSVFGGWTGSFRVQGESRVTRPAEYIRRIRALEELAGEG
ncbi:MAG TPA: hypothetical protein IAB98_06325 [Candidatus Egerieimonas intestinavium]|uniref:Pilus assembly protein n=1 Tax=Candidatus Egerieimonas intestinavium TaxID=2840777 RepID=A0A9D1EJL1_9FIRM|nr:hypothetical protein [Candidatus Egerieimonas intestinavium]